jgi:hypothetical protein
LVTIAAITDIAIRFLDTTDDYVSRELTQDHAESGIADYDGLLEQIGSPDWHGARGGMV